MCPLHSLNQHNSRSGDPTRVAAGPLGTSMASQQGSARRPRVGGGGSGSEERFRAAFKIISDTVTKLDLDQDVREAAQVPSCDCCRPPVFASLPHSGTSQRRNDLHMLIQRKHSSTPTCSITRQAITRQAITRLPCPALARYRHAVARLCSSELGHIRPSIAAHAVASPCTCDAIMVCRMFTPWVTSHAQP